MVESPTGGDAAVAVVRQQHTHTTKMSPHPLVLVAAVLTGCLTLAAALSVRVINDAPDVALVSIDGSLFTTSAADTISDYLPVSVAAPFVFNISSGSGVFVTPPVTGAYDAYTLLIGRDLTRLLRAAVFADASTPMPSGAGQIDTCQVRVLNSMGQSVDVFWVTSECHKCRIPPAFKPNSVAFMASGPAGAMYALVDCSRDLTVRVVSADGYMNLTIDAALIEHGSYTLLVHDNVIGNRVAAPEITLLADVPGADPYLPIAYAAIILTSLGLAHWGLGVLLVGCGAVSVPPSGSSRKKSSAAEGDAGVFAFVNGVAQSVFRFLGYHSRALAAAQRAAERGDDDRKGGETMVAPFLGSPEPYHAGSLLDENESSGAQVPSAGRGAGAVKQQQQRDGNLLSASPRFRSIDTLRGACLAIMIFVNYGGGGYWFFDHSDWNGLTVADLVFPIFVWTQGVSMAISFNSARRKGASSLSLAQKTVLRAMKLYALGLFLNGGANLSQWRVIGVLHYFAVAYLVVGLLESLAPVLSSSPCGSNDDTDSASAGGVWAPPTLDSTMEDITSSGKGKHRRREQQQQQPLPVQTLSQALWVDIGRHAVQWGVMLVLGATYLLLQYFLPVPGCPTGYIGPGGLADGGAYEGLGCTGGAHRYIDILLFGVNHIYHSGSPPRSSATCSGTYNCDVYDPEGALGFISASWMTFLGLQAGRVFVNNRSLLTTALSGGDKWRAVGAHVVRWVLWGLVLGAIGGGLAGFSKDDGLIPINKNLWSPSFVLCMASIGFLALALFFVLVDVLNHWSGAPFVYPGMNSIIVYCGSELFDNLFPFKVSLNGSPVNHAEALFSNLLGVCCWIAVARLLYLRRIFVNL